MPEVDRVTLCGCSSCDAVWGFLESLPEVAAKLKEPGTKDSKFEDVVKSTEKADVLVLVY
jgi:hypothetical protein